MICNNPVIWQSEKAVRMKNCDLFNVQEQIGSNRLGISAICQHYDTGNKTILSFIIERYRDNDALLTVDSIDRLLHPFQGD